ncbi:MAG: MFS transporter [Planctomycetota bacterium]|nr:MAG: MFS transporter [Planctomycetota bacterium]
MRPPEFLRSDDLPPMSRLSFVWEQRYFLLWGCVTGAVEGNIAAIVAKKTFEAPDALASFIWGLPITMNLVNLVWGAWLRGRRIVPTLRLLTLCAAVCVASIALTPRTWGVVGALIFAAQLALTHFLFSGLLTVRVAIWRANYPPSHRARITGRIQTLRFLIVLAGGAIVSTLFDVNPDSYRLIYIAVAALGLSSVIVAGRLRIRGEARALAHQRESETPRGGPRGIVASLREAGAILRGDRAFARYMAAQFLLGSANFFTDGVLVTELSGRMEFGYYFTNLFMLQIPTVLMLVAIRPWSQYIDRRGVVRFRVVSTALWLASYACVCAAMLLAQYGAAAWLWAALALLAAGRIINGVCRGGGSLAWSLGHLHFARPEQAEIYMGIHVGLTGLRGLLMPNIGAAVNALAGNASFAIPVALAAIALWMFRRIDHDTRTGLITPQGDAFRGRLVRPEQLPGSPT